MYVDWQTIITLGSIITALALIARYMRKTVLWIEKQERQEKDINSIKEEQTLIVYGVLCCLKGLSEQGCDGPVHDAIDKIERHLNIRAHE